MELFCLRVFTNSASTVDEKNVFRKEVRSGDAFEPLIVCCSPGAERFLSQKTWAKIACHLSGAGLE